MVSKRPLEALLSCYKLVPVLALQNPSVVHSALLQAIKWRSKTRPGHCLACWWILSIFWVLFPEERRNWGWLQANCWDPERKVTGKFPQELLPVKHGLDRTLGTSLLLFQVWSGHQQHGQLLEMVKHRASPSPLSQNLHFHNIFDWFSLKPCKPHIPWM